jgi:hypothetical protein
MELIIRINDAIVSQGFNTFERIAQLHYGVEAQKTKHYSEIQSQQVAQDGVQMLSDLFKQFLNQMHGSNIIDALMKFVEINPQQKQPSEPKPQPQPEPKEEIATTGSPEE